MIRGRATKKTIERQAIDHTVNRETAGGSYDENGFYTAGFNSELTIALVALPMSAEELLSLPEGQREADWKVLWSTTELKNKDVVIVDTEEFTIEKVKTYPGIVYRAEAMNSGVA